MRGVTWVAMAAGALALASAATSLEAQAVTASGGTSSVPLVPAKWGLLSLNPSAKEIGLTFSRLTLGETGSWSLGATAKATASNSVASILSGGTLVPGASGSVTVGRDLTTKAGAQDEFRKCMEELPVRPTDQPWLSLPDSTGLDKCIDRYGPGGIPGGVWIFATGMFDATTYKIFDPEAPLDQQITKEAFRGYGLAVSLNWWTVLGGRAAFGGFSVGWQDGNTIGDMTEVQVRDQVYSAQSGDFARSVTRKDVTAWQGTYGTYASYPVAVDLFLSHGPQESTGTWFYGRVVEREGEGRDTQTAAGVGIYQVDLKNPLAPTAAISLERSFDKKSWSINLVGSISAGVPISALGG